MFARRVRALSPSRERKKIVRRRSACGGHLVRTERLETFPAARLDKPRSLRPNDDAPDDARARSRDPAVLIRGNSGDALRPEVVALANRGKIRSGSRRRRRAVLTVLPATTFAWERIGRRRSIRRAASRIDPNRLREHGLAQQVRDRKFDERPSTSGPPLVELTQGRDVRRVESTRVTMPQRPAQFQEPITSSSAISFSSWPKSWRCTARPRAFGNSCRRGRLRLCRSSWPPRVRVS
jgi:hypothetical protein